MGGIMSYKRFRQRNNLARAVSLDADPYSTPLGGLESISRYVALGDLNRFERDLLGLSCWCDHREGCETCGHAWQWHPLDKGEAGDQWAWPCLYRDCTCAKWKPFGPTHSGGEVCPSNHYAAQVAKRINEDRSPAEGVALYEEDVRAVLRALMEVD
jgi:hypothetical protein